jgi:hypothetical protein
MQKDTIVTNLHRSTITDRLGENAIREQLRFGHVDLRLGRLGFSAAFKRVSYPY